MEEYGAAITNSIRNATLKFIDVRNAILAEEVQRKDSGEASTSNSALNVDNRGRSFEMNKGNENRGKSKNGKGKSRNGRILECWNCGKTGHLKKNCRAISKNKNKNDAANVVTDEVWDVLILSIDDLCESWELDSSASSTLRHNVIFWRTITRNHAKVYLANGEPSDMISIEDVRLKMPNGSVWKIQKGETWNLISMGQLDDKGFDKEFNFNGPTR